ncbi:hypothetical protein SDC9_74943 [bioreactor metagenome]|uniref:Uncharacterized protein n=1 Tax=bioreactor metagenome TaxID=1076179 RepID=A0A644YKL2_9ZZZZ
MDKDVLYIEKAKLIESIVDIDDINIIKKVRSFLKRSVSSRRPAIMTIEELKKEVTEATEDVLKGNGVKHDDFIKEMKTWM